MALYETAANIINDVAVEVGLAASANVWSSTDPMFVQLRYLLKSCGRRLVLEHAWLQCRKEYTFTTTTASSYSMPADFMSAVDQSWWNRTRRMPMRVASPQEFEYLKAAVAGVVFTVLFLPSDQSIELWPQPPAVGETIAGYYRSRYWVASSGTTPSADAPAANTDTVLLDVQLITRCLKLAFLQAKGFDSSAAQAEYDSAFESVKNANAVAAPVIHMDDEPTMDRLVDMANAPASGFGFDGGGGLL